MPAVDSLAESIKDAIAEDVASEFFHRSGGETRHYFEGIELVLTAIAGAFLVPFVKKLAEKSAEEAWTKLTKPKPKSGPQAPNHTSEPVDSPDRLIMDASDQNLSDAISHAASEVRAKLQAENFSGEIEERIVFSIVRRITKVREAGYDSAQQFDKYTVNTQVADRVKKQFWRQRFNIQADSMSSTEIQICQLVLSRLEAVNLYEGDAKGFQLALDAAASLARQSYALVEIGSWSLAGILALTKLATAGSSIPQRHTFFQSFLVTKLWAANRQNLDSLVAAYLIHTIKQGDAGVVRMTLDALKRSQEAAAEAALDSTSITEWLEQLSALAPLVDAQFLLHRCLLALAANRTISETEISALGFDLQHCKSEAKRLEEMIAHIGSPGIESFTSKGIDGVKYYLNKIGKVANESGEGAARRQTIADIARLLVPRFLAHEAVARLLQSPRNSNDA